MAYNAQTQQTETLRLFPAFLDLRHRRVVVVGGGEVAKRKIDALSGTGARIAVIAPEIDQAIREVVVAGTLEVHQREFMVDDLTDAWLVIAATDDRVLNQGISEQAYKLKIFANVVDDAELSSFQSPARVERGPLQIAISTRGVAPMFARWIREKLETQFDDSIATLATLLEQERETIRHTLPQTAERRKFFDLLLQGPIASVIKSTGIEAGRAKLKAVLEAFARPRENKQNRTGHVAIVGAGPGDPALLTLRALRVLNQADVILTDQLVSKEIIDLARRDAQIISVGKQGGGACIAQAEIHALMLKHAALGQTVVRLKGGDPFVFGRGGEELQCLRAAGISYEVVPGITAALACAAYSGIPLTHRDYAQSVRFVTAHCKQSIETLDWKELSEDTQTLVFYMGVSRLETISLQMQHSGRSGDTPVALIENGSRAEQRVLRTDLAHLVQHAREANIQAPALLIVGKVAALNDDLHWFGERVVVDQVQSVVEETADQKLRYQEYLEAA